MACSMKNSIVNCLLYTPVVLPLSQCTTILLHWKLETCPSEVENTGAHTIWSMHKHMGIKRVDVGNKKKEVNVYERVGTN